MFEDAKTIKLTAESIKKSTKIIFIIFPNHLCSQCPASTCTAPPSTATATGTTAMSRAGGYTHDASVPTQTP